MAEVQDGYHQDARIQSYIMILLLAQIAAMLYSTETSCHYGYNTIIQPDITNPWKLCYHVRSAKEALPLSAIALRHHVTRQS